MKLNTMEQIRVDVIIKYINGEIQLEDALSILELGERQFRRLLKAFRESGFESIKHGNTNKEPKNKITSLVRNKIIQEYKYKYSDFNITHFREKLKADPDIICAYNIPSYQSIRRILLDEKLITHKTQKKRRAYKPRKRYEKEGLMVQIDGSHHHWIYGHPMFCLTAAIDDATGKILAAKFTRTETTFAAMDVVKDIVTTYGCFQMLYSDKAGIYGGSKRVGYTNMDRAMRELGITSIQASTPQAKGKIERLFKTLQDRLVSEMRLRGIQTMEGANSFLQEEYIDHFNKKFSIPATGVCYRPLSKEIDLKEVFCMKEDRVVGNGNIFSFKSISYYVETCECFNKKTVEIRNYPDGSMAFYIMGDEVKEEQVNKKKIAS